MTCEKIKIVKYFKIATTCFLVVLCLVLTFHLGRLYQIKEDEKSLMFMSGIVDRSQNQSNILIERLKKVHPD